MQQQKMITFYPFVSVRSFVSTQDGDAPIDAQARRKTSCNAPLINTDGKVCPKRRIHQHTSTSAVISYQRQLHKRMNRSDNDKGQNNLLLKHLSHKLHEQYPNCNGCTNTELLLAHVSTKLSQRAKDIALETARQTLLEIYPASSSHSNDNQILPIPISEFPKTKKRARMEEGAYEYETKMPPHKCRKVSL